MAYEITKFQGYHRGSRRFRSRTNSHGLWSPTGSSPCRMAFPSSTRVARESVSAWWHPSNPRAPAENDELGMVVFFVPPHVVLGVGSHHTEECYVILKGRGTMTLAGWNRSR